MVSQQHAALRLENAESFEEEKTNNPEIGLAVNATVFEREKGDNPAGVQVVDNSQCETNQLHDNLDNKQSKWHHRIRIRNKKVQQHETLDANQSKFIEISQKDETEEPYRQNSVTFANAPKDRWYQKLKMHKKNKNVSESNLVMLEEIKGEEDDGNHNLKTMEALGIYGLLTPAIAAVPATDEFDTVHKQIKTELGGDWELKLAAAHIDDALKGRGKYGKARSYFSSKFSQRCFKVLDNIWYERFFLLVILVHSMIIFFEPPSSSLNSVHAIVYVINALCLLIYIFDLVLRIQTLSWRIFWSKETVDRYWNGVQFILICAFWVDFIILCTSVLVNKYLPQPFRCLRLVMLLCRVHSIRYIFEVLAIIGTSLLKVLFIILVFIITFASIGVHLFMTTYNTKFRKTANSTESEFCCVQLDDEESIYIGAFDHVGIAILRLFVLLSTENYPEIMLPALRRSKFYFFFFGIFVFFGGFFLTAILLAIVVDSYWVFAKKTIKKERARERTELAKAWNLLDPLGLGALSVDDKQFIELFRILKPKNTDDQNLMLIHLLDSQGDGEIDSFEWTTTLRQALNAEFEEDASLEEEDRPQSKILIRIRKEALVVAESDTFSKIMLCLILFHGVLFCLKWRGQASNCELAIHGIRTAITIIFVFEIAIRIVALGKQILHMLELIDVSLVFVAVIFNCLWYINITSWNFKEMCVIVSSLAVIIRWLLNSSGTRKAFRWFLNIVPVMFDLVILLFVILYLLSTIAMEIFHSYGLPADNQIYPDSCKLGFKDFWCSFLIMFQTLTTSNWHEIMNLAAAETKSSVAYFFFPLSFVVITLVVMNLFVAIAIEAANKLTSKSSGSVSGSLKPQPTLDSPDEKPLNTFNKILTAMAKNVLGSARVEETQDRNKREPINSPMSSSTMTLTGKRKGSSTIILSPPSSKRDTNGNRRSDANGNNQTADNDVEPSDDEDENVEDYSGLSPKAKREKMLKNRMKKKKRKARQRIRKTSAQLLDQIQKQVRAIASFRGSQPTDLDFTVGDTITVIATRDEWMQGECRGTTGWFPASHVVNWSAKVLHEARGSLSKVDRDDVIVVNDAAVATENKEQSRPKTPTNEQPTENESLLVPKKRTSSLSPQPNYRIKMKSGDWRREILGDMTVMNAEEMRELNKVMRAELRAPGSRGSKPNIAYRRKPSSPTTMKRNVIPTVEEVAVNDQHEYRSRESTIDGLGRPRASTSTSNEVFHAESPGPRTSADNTRSRSNTGNSLLDSQPQSAEGGSGSQTRFPVVSVSQLSTMEFQQTPRLEATPEEKPPTEESEIKSEEKPGEKDYLAIEKQSDKSRAKKKAKNPSGEMPEWAKKFAETKNISVVSDVKFQEPPIDEAALPGSVETKDAQVIP